MQNKERNNAIDMAKGIGILLVVWGHYMVPNPPLFREIFLFHMPFFFIISGAFYKTDSSVTKHIWRRTKRLLFPLFLYCLLFSFIMLIKSHIGETTPIKEMFSGFDVNKPFAMIDAPLWFLIVLFVCDSLLTCMHFMHNRVGAFLGLGISFLATFMYPHPLYLTQTLSVLIFFQSGILLKNYIQRPYNPYIFSISLITYVMMVVFNQAPTNIHELQFGENYLFYLLSGFSGSFLLIELCKLLPLMPPLVELGRNSLHIMALHQPIRGYALLLAGIMCSHGIFSFFSYGLIFFFLVLICHYLGIMVNKYITSNVY